MVVYILPNNYLFDKDYLYVICFNRDLICRGEKFMPDKVTIDFEKELVTWETNIQKGTDSCPGISPRKSLRKMTRFAVLFAVLLRW